MNIREIVVTGCRNCPFNESGYWCSNYYKHTFKSLNLKIPLDMNERPKWCKLLKESILIKTNL